LRMAMADEGELGIIAPAVKEFGEDPAIDQLIRKHGYKGTSTILKAVKEDPELSKNLSAAATLIHGSTEGRFRVTYATNPALLSKEEVESVGFCWMNINDAEARYGTSPKSVCWRKDAEGEDFFAVPNPALGLWIADK